MPRRGENIYKRKDGRWEARILKPDGKYKSVYSKSYKEVKEKKRTYEDNLQIKEIPLNSIDKVSSQFESWLNSDSVRQLKPSTYEYYYRCIKNYVIPYFNKDKNQRITVLSVHTFVKSIRNNNSLSEAYKRKILAVFKTALRSILKGSGESALVLETVKLPAVPNQEILVFSMKEQRIIEDTILHYADKRALGILLSFYTGIRLGELCALKWEDLDFETRTITITKTVSRLKNFEGGENKTILLVGSPKSIKSIRKIPLPSFLITMLDKYNQCKNDNGYIISGSEMPVEPRTYQKLYASVLKKARVKYRKFHAIRHTFATRSLELGVDIKTLSDILGHSSVSITLNTYAHSLMEQKIIAIEKLNSMHYMFMESDSFIVNEFVKQPESPMVMSSLRR